MRDTLGLRHATRVKHQQPVKPVHKAEHSDINRCLTCTIPASRCKGAAKCSLVETRGRKKNPCKGCNMSGICQRNNWTCWQKREFDRK